MLAVRWRVFGVFAGQQCPQWHGLAAIDASGLKLPKTNNAINLLVGDMYALHAQGGGRVARKIEHVALAQQAFRARLVEDDAAVDAAGDGEGNARRAVGFDETGDDIHRRALGAMTR